MIKKVRNVSNSSAIGYWSGPALALDKLEITYEKRYEIVLISPKNETKKHLIMKNKPYTAIGHSSGTRNHTDSAKGLDCLIIMYSFMNLKNSNGGE